MNPLRTLDDRLMLAVNAFARHTGWLHAPFLAYASYGVVLFALLLLAGVLVARHRSDRDLAAAGWACLATLLAVALNQPVGHLFAEARPYAVHPGLLRLADPTRDFSFPSDHAVMAGAVAAGLLLVVPAARAGRRRGGGADGLRPGLHRGALPVGRPRRTRPRCRRRDPRLAAVRRPLAALTGWLRSLPGLRAVFARQPSREQQDVTVAR